MQGWRSSRFAFWVLAPFGVIVLLLGGVGLAFVRHFNPKPPSMSYPDPADALDAQRQDLDYFGRLLAYDRSFTPSARQQADAAVAALKNLRQPVDLPHLRVALMQIDALTDNGHSRVTYAEAYEPKELPIRVALFSDGLYVMRTRLADTELLGGRVLSVDNLPIAEVMQRLSGLRGGTPQWRMGNAVVYLTTQDILYGLGIAPDLQHSTWSLLTPLGSTVTRTLEAYQAPKEEGFAYSKRWLSSEPLPGLTDGWASFQPDRPAPLPWADFDTAFRRIRLPGSGTMFLQLKSNEDVGKQRIKDFLRDTLDDLRQQKARNLILDLRYNGGGDYTNTYAFGKKLPTLVEPGGKILLLTGPGTFSAGITTTAFVKQSGGNQVMVLGEPVGDRLRFYSEGGRGCLPHAKLCVAYETGKHDYAGPCTDLSDCFWLNYIFAVRVKTLEPDETIPQSFADWRQGRDRVFERALQLAGP